MHHLSPVLWCDSVEYTVDNRIPHIKIPRRHIDFGPQCAGTVCKFTGPHALEQIKILFHGPITIRTIFARLGQGAAVFPHLLRAQVADICLAFS